MERSKTTTGKSKSHFIRNVTTKKTTKTSEAKLEMREGIDAENSVDLLKYEKHDIKGDAVNFALLTFLYFIQGAVAGLMMAVPLILQKRDCTYPQQAKFHLSTYAVSFKILWVPILDSLFMKGEGRRKFVAMMMQYLIGAFLLVVSLNVDKYLGNDEGTIDPDVEMLTIIFFLCSLFSSIQDVALDGWSLTIFQKKNKLYSASCRGLGVSLGVMIVLPGFINLESTYFADLFRSRPGVAGFVDFKQFTLFLSAVFIVTTTLIVKFKKEKLDEDIEIDLTKADKVRNQDVLETYAHLWKMLKLGPTQMMVFFLLTWHIGFGPISNVTTLKLLDHGVPRNYLSIVLVCGIPGQLCLPFLLNRYITRPQPVRIFVIAYIIRLINGLVYASLIFVIFLQGKPSTRVGRWYFPPLVIILSIDHIAVFAMIMAIVALFTRISHHEFGNAFMTLVISLNSLGGSWPSTVCLWLVNFATINPCEKKGDPSCSNEIDGFYVEIAVCTLIGLIWIHWAKKQITKLEKTEAALMHDSG